MTNIELTKPGKPQAAPDFYSQSWWKRWWPTLTAAGATVCCLAVLGVQQAQLQELQREVESLKQQLTEKPNPVSEPAPAPSVDIPNGQAELATLRAEARQLATDTSALEALKSQNQQLKAQAAPPQETLDPEEVQAMQQAQDRAFRIQCVNNLKQLGLAARIWGTDHQDINPPNIEAMTQEISAPSILTCPGDPARKPANSWQTYTAANLSYEFLAPSAPETEPNRVLFRCPIHGSITLVDGSVQQLTAERAARSLIQRDGKLYFGSPEPSPNISEQMRARYGLAPPRSAISPNKASPTPTYNMSPEMMKRYGLLPQQTTNPPANPNP